MDTDCDPIVTMDDLGISKSMGGTQLSGKTVANPCGLIAKYMFNDKFRLAEGTRTIPIDETKIAHEVDRESKFKAPKNQNKIAWTDVEDEHLMVWYQMETFPSFIKLWGHIDETLKAGNTYTFYVSNNFDVSEYDAKKYIYLSEVNDFGGKNAFMGYVFLVIAGVVLLIIFIFIVLYFVRLRGNKNIYSTDNMEW